MQKVSLFSLKLLQKQTPATELHMQLMFFHGFQGKKLWHDANQILSQVFFTKKLLDIKCALKYSLWLPKTKMSWDSSLRREFDSTALKKKKNQKPNKQNPSHQKETFLS